jgi:hypothetical protein
MFCMMDRCTASAIGVISAMIYPRLFQTSNTPAGAKASPRVVVA